VDKLLSFAKYKHFLFQYFAGCLVYWYTLIYFTMERVTCRGSTFNQIRRWERYYLIIGWLLPLILAVIPASFDKLGYEMGLFWCWISDDRSIWKFCCLYGELFVCMILCMVWMFRIVRTLTSLRSDTQDNSSVFSSHAFLVNDYLRRHGFFVIATFIVFVQVFSWGVNYALVQRGDSSLSYWFATTEILSVCGLGTITFLSFGLTRQNYDLLCNRRNPNADDVNRAKISTNDDPDLQFHSEFGDANVDPLLYSQHDNGSIRLHERM